MSLGISYSSKGLQSVCPTGLTFFDNLIGGGFATTSIAVIDEDQFRTYSSMVAKAYLSSGIIAKQNIIIFSPTIKSIKSRFIRELPSFQNVSENNNRSSVVQDSMKIAFRYTNLPSRFEQIDFNGKQKLDYGTYLDPEILENASIKFYEHSQIIEILQQLVATGNGVKKVNRILIDCLGSPLSDLEDYKLPEIIHLSKVLMRRLSNSVCLTTLVSPEGEEDLLELSQPTVRSQIHYSADCVLRLTAFEECDQANPYRTDYVAFLHLLRLPRLNSFAPYNPCLDSTQFGLKLHNSKRYLTVERLALPPDLSETVSRFDTPKISCSSNLYQTDSLSF